MSGKIFLMYILLHPLFHLLKLNHLKHQIVNRLKIPFVKFENIIASDIKIPNTFKMNKANLILSGSEFQENIHIGSHVYISNNTVICSETEINNYVNISNSASIQGGVKIEEGAYIGANSSIIGYTKIGKWSIIGMGSVVLNDVEDFEIVAGNPARVIGINKVAKDYFVENNLINGKNSLLITLDTDWADHIALGFCLKIILKIFD